LWPPRKLVRWSCFPNFLSLLHRVVSGFFFFLFSGHGFLVFFAAGSPCFLKTTGSNSFFVPSYSCFVCRTSIPPVSWFWVRHSCIQWSRSQGVCFCFCPTRLPTLEWPISSFGKVVPRGLSFSLRCMCPLVGTGLLTSQLVLLVSICFGGCFVVPSCGWALGRYSIFFFPLFVVFFPFLLKAPASLRVRRIFRFLISRL